MNAQEYNSCLLNMPELVIDKIMSNIDNLSNVSRTCKYLYEIVCGMEKRRRVLYISAYNIKSPLNVDADTVFDSIMNSHRTIKKIELRVDYSSDYFYKLNKRQLERLTAIMKQFGADITSLKFEGFLLPINFIHELLQRTPKLESLSFTRGEVVDSLRENTTMSLQLPSLKALEIIRFRGSLDIVNLISAGSLNSIHYKDEPTESTGVIATILTRQHNIKSLHLAFVSNSNTAALCIDDLQLETLVLESYEFDSSVQFLEILKCQTNLKELRFLNYRSGMSGRSFQWICDNLKKLEVFEVYRVDLIEGNVFEMLGQLKKLRHFRTNDADFLFRNGFQTSQFKSDAKKVEFGFLPISSCGERLNKVVNSMTHNLPNLTHLKMSFKNFSALCCVLRHCKKIVHLTSYIIEPRPDEFTQQRFPSIETLNLHSNLHAEGMSQSMSSIVRAMPNLTSMSISMTHGFKFDTKAMKEFIKESKSLEYFYLDRFELHPELSADDVVETIRCLTDQLKGYHIKFRSPTSPEDLKCHAIKGILSNASSRNT